ncbi:olfactory receptor 2AT4-like [Latimeria chalumnae]|uniref:olfactory receptor 2AT4-like n=1 Tax=Latimeria chalumnae TaxID=7897 RepID=UPI0003C175BB|nr:PREDICTED: olfactory receptor 2AT4-like [Latimeria chalumnae]|eukprot:XP_006008702.1 PREDICTED: olfactory receptor 2AT4-like [Latimeria chalumnae]
MEIYNQSTHQIIEFIIIGFPGLQDYEVFLFPFFLAVYLITLIGNVLILIAVKTSQKLHMPMYFFLANLSVIDVMYTTTTLPKLLSKLLLDDKTISFTGCFLQMYFFVSLGLAECCILVIMAYDRYVAICDPLRYNIKMKKEVCILLAASAWIISFAFSSGPLIQASRLTYCGPYNVYQCFCDYSAVVKLACADTIISNASSLSIVLSVLVLPCMIIVASYVKIIISVLKAASGEGRRKAFSTCVSHLLVVVIFFSSAWFAYVSYRIPRVTVDLRILCVVLYAFLTPMVNPIIYCLRNKEIRDAITKISKVESILGITQNIKASS